MVRLLFLFGVNLNVRVNGFYIFFYIVVLMDNLDCVEEFLKYNVDIISKDEFEKILYEIVVINNCKRIVRVFKIEGK